MSEVQLGDKVEDTATGFRGIVTCISLYLSGSSLIRVQPVVSDYGIMPVTVEFDPGRLKCIKSIDEKNKSGKIKSVS